MEQLTSNIILEISIQNDYPLKRRRVVIIMMDNLSDEFDRLSIEFMTKFMRFLKQTNVLLQSSQSKRLF